MTEWPLRRTLSRSLPNGDYIEVVAGLHQLDGNERPYWSVTCSVWEKRGSTLIGKRRHTRGCESDMGGPMHELIREAFPELEPVIAVHLADDLGVPMHAVANGWYFYSGQAREYEERHPKSYLNPDRLNDLERAARALHIPASELPAFMGKEKFEAFAEGLRPRWREQSDAARTVLEAMPEEEA